MGTLGGRVVVVTGGNGGIGLGLAKGVAKSGADVCVWGRNPEKNEVAVKELSDLGVRALALQCDVSNESSVCDAAASTVEHFGKIDALFANAGISAQRQSFLETTTEEWLRVLTTNLVGAVLCMREAAKDMISRGEGGALIAVSSVSAIHGAPGVLPYGASKTALLGTVRGLAVELARYKIRCNAVLPGWIETEMTEPLQANEKFMSVTVGRTPHRRWGLPSDFESAAAFLADPCAVFHTGDTMVIDGGYTVF